jgi:hypothetical protein
MKSPFPGMDPYLEARWGDVHTSLITYARDQLQQQMPRDLRVRVEEYITEGGIAVAEPLLVPRHLEEQTQRSLQIIDTRSGNRVVTDLEFLSPVNKSDAVGRAAYLQKQGHLLRAKVNLVEIDLLRAGPYVLSAPAHAVPLPYLSPYRICVVRASRQNLVEVYRVALSERLPTFRIPLRETDADAHLKLQELIELAYENGGYDAEIDYRVDPFPPLQGEDAVWASALLREKGRR